MTVLRFIFIILFLSLSLMIFGQSQINKEIKNLNINLNSFDSRPLFEISNASRNAVSPMLDKKEVLTILPEALDYLHKNPGKIKVFEVPVNGRNRQIIAQEVALLGPEYSFGTKGGKRMRALERPTQRFYHGVFTDDQNAIVAITVDDQKVNLLISDEAGNREILHHTGQDYVSYLSKDLPQHNNFECLVADNAGLELKSRTEDYEGSRTPGLCVEVYFELDYRIFTDHGSNASSVENWLLTLFNQVSLLYANEGIPIAISSANVWNTPDPYAAMSTFNILTNWAANIQNSHPNKLCHFLSGRPLNSGIAWVNALCSSYNASNHSGPYAVSTSLSTTIVGVPTYSWNVEVVTHEMGHNMGSQHTHDCVWNGNGTAIDACASNGGACTANADPTDDQTIMSYCHLSGQPGILFSRGFGPQPGDRIRSRYNNTTCSTGSACADLSPVNDFCSSAFTLLGSKTCTVSSFTNANATSSGASPGFSCGSPGTVKDVWFKTTVLDPQVIIETSQVTGGLTNTVVQVYSGTCSVLTSIACDDNSGAGNHARVSLTGRTIGETLYIRVIDSGSNDVGLFGICVYSPNLPCSPTAELLIDFYNETGGPNWFNKTGWIQGAAGTNCNVCSWYGVLCASGIVWGLNLEKNNLTSSNFPTSIFEIPNLQAVNFWDNNLGGTLPDLWDEIPLTWYLDISYNNLSGPLPPSLESLTNLETFWMENNFNLSGPLPTAFGNFQSLEVLYGANNNFSGCFPGTYTNLCGFPNFGFPGNAGLPNGGNITSFCISGFGGDFDEDGFCAGVNDCDDENAAIHPGATEICDGQDNNCNDFIDEMVNPVSNEWQGGSGSFLSESSWSLGFVPVQCAEVLFADRVSPITVTIPPGQDIQVQTLYIGQNVTLVVQSNTILEVENSHETYIRGLLVNNGNIVFKH